MKSKACHYCGKGAEVDEMRPYGPGGSWIHYRCMMADPAREAGAKRNFGALLDAAQAVGSGVATIGEGCEDGPVPGAP